MSADNFFTRVEYVSFDHDIPPSVRSASKECKPFNLRLPIGKDWKSSKKRLLIICEHVHTEDLREGRLLGSNSLDVLTNCYKYARKLAKNANEPVQDFAFAAINFNFFKTYHLTPQQQADLHVDSICAKRVRRFIEKYKPTHIFISGVQANSALLRMNIENVDYKLGWIHDTEINGIPVKVTNSIDYIKSISKKKGRFDDDDDDEDDNEKDMAGAYLLGYFSRNLRNCLIGKNPYGITNLVPNPRLVDSIEKFDKMMEIIDGARVVAVDTETQGLNRIRNKVYTFQFAVSSKVGYVLPYLHPESPFNQKELKYIKKRLRAFFSKPVPVIPDAENFHALVMFNGKYDLTQIRRDCGVRVVHWPVWDCRAGEFCLDENLRFMRVVAKVGTKALNHGGLAQLLCNYGVDFYYSAKFGKEDRGDMDNTSIRDEGFLQYAGFDVQSLIAMVKMQIRRAREEVYTENGKTISYEQDFMRMMICQMSNNIHVFSNMEHRGVNIDRKHLLFLKTRQSPISIAIREAAGVIYKSPAVKKANQYLLDRKEVPTGNTLLGKTPFIFNINKPEHKEVLFIDIMGLEPISYGKSGRPSLGKLFKKTYENVEEVQKLNDLEKAKKLKSSYVDAFVRRLMEGDGAVDGRLRPSFDFFPVVTGRSNSSDPSLQQIPQRGSQAKHIKRMFTASRGKLLIKQDYSAHEIRMWSVISFDKVLAELFQVGRDLRRKFFKTSNKKYKDELALKGDVHKLNVNFFFGTPIDKVTKEERDQIKGVGFGAIYGKSPKTLAKELKKATEFMEDLFKKFFGRFKRASGWLNWAKEFSEKHYFVKSIIGRRRYLFGFMTGINRIVSAMKRRAMNSPIQGMGADLGHTSSRLFSIHMEKVLFDLKRITDEVEMLPVDVEVMVHDSTRLEAQFDLMLVSIHLLQWCATQGVVDWYKKYHGFGFTVYPEVEMEFGVDESRMYKWDWSLEGEPPNEKDDSFSLKYCLTRSVTDYCELYPEDNATPEKLLKKIYADWENSKVKSYLDKHYPILPDDGKGEKQ